MCADLVLAVVASHMMFITQMCNCSHFIVSYYSIDVTKKEQENTYECVVPKSLAAGDNHPFNKTGSKNDAMINTNPTYDECKISDPESKQINADDIVMDENPAYGEAKFT